MCRDRSFYVTISDLFGQKNIRWEKDVDPCVLSLPQPNASDDLTLLQFPECVDRRLSAASQSPHCFLYRQFAEYAAGFILPVYCKRFSVFFQNQREQQLCRFGEILCSGSIIEAFGDQINVGFVVVHSDTSFQYFRATKKRRLQKQTPSFTLSCIDRHGKGYIIPFF